MVHPATPFEKLMGTVQYLLTALLCSFLTLLDHSLFFSCLHVPIGGPLDHLPHNSSDLTYHVHNPRVKSSANDRWEVMINTGTSPLSSGTAHRSMFLTISKISPEIKLQLPTRVSCWVTTICLVSSLFCFTSSFPYDTFLGLFPK